MDSKSYRVDDDTVNVATFYGSIRNRDVYRPGAGQLIPEVGAWAMITRSLPAIEGDIDREFRPGRVFYVERLRSGVDSEGFGPDGTYKVRCLSPWGELCLWPYEYGTIDSTTLVELWTAGELVFHPLRVDEARFSEVAFYARSRGIGLADAAVMALGGLAGAGVGWFEPRSDLAEQCETLAEAMS